MDKQGLLLCARYSVAPNFYGYCGPPKNQNLVDHLKENIADREVQSILSEFETLHLYLKLIAKDNKIPDVFDRKVVEAYWLGNTLLNNIKDLNYTSLLEEKFFLTKKMEEKNFKQIKSKILSYKFLPHHSFHVFNIFKRTGSDPSFHTLKTMDECRIGWGKIRIKNLIIETKPLEIKEGLLQLGEPILKEIKYDYRGINFIKNLKVGDWISFHWSFACDILNVRQIKNLEYFTQKSIDFFNQQ